MLIIERIETLSYKLLTDTTISFLKDGLHHRHLIWRLTKTKLSLQVKRSSLGVFWIFFTPLTTVAVWFVLHKTGLLHAGVEGVPYIIYLISGVTIFNLFSSTYDLVSRCVVENTNIMLDVTIPRSVFVYEKVISSLIRFLMLFVVTLIFMVASGFKFSATSLVTPVFLLPLLFFAVATGIVFSLLRVVLVDVAMLADKLIHLIIFITPVFYNRLENTVFLQKIVAHNPFTYLVCIPRDVLIYGSLPDVSTFAWCFLISTVLLLLAIHFFEKANLLVTEKLLV